MAERQDIERVDVGLIPNAQQALWRLTELTGHNRSDCINRAIQAYVELEQARAAGKRVYLIDDDGKSELLRWSR